MALYEYKIGIAVTATGTVTISAESNTVAGSGTLFGTEIVVGDLIVVEGQVRVVATTPTAESATVTANWSAAAAGVAFEYVSFDNVEALGLPAPKGNEPVAFSKTVELGDGTVRGLGWMTTAWDFGFLTQAQRDVLKAYCPQASAEVYIRTHRNEATLDYANYKAVMAWPPGKEANRAGRVLDLSITFRRMEEI